jgi:agmatinase
LSTRQALDLLATATGRATLVGLDIVEVSPPFDTGDITTFAALKLIFEVWGMVWSRPGTAHSQVAEGHGKR